MKKALPWAALAAAVFLTACGGSAGSADGADSADDADNRATEGPLSFEVPEDWEQIPVDGELPEHAWTLGYTDDLEEGTMSLRVMPDVDSRADPSVAVSTLIAVCRFTDVYADDCRGTGQENADIPGADEAVRADFTYTGVTDEEGLGSIWVAVDEASGVVAAVEYAGLGVDEAELAAFAETIEFDPSNAD